MQLRTPLLGSLLSLCAVLPLRPHLCQDADGKRVTPIETLEGMHWLAGSWVGEMWGGEFHAFYSTPVGGKILSHSKLLQEHKVAFYEFEVFEPHEQGVVMRPFPGGQHVDDLMLDHVDASERKATFENPEKDYPTRITYQRVSDDELEIVLSDPHGESDKVERFKLRRVASED